VQPLARTTPERLAGLFLFGVVYPGIGPRMAAPDRLNEIWYQSFNQMEMAPGLVGATRESCRTFIAHFLRHWSHRKEAFDDVIEAFTDNFLKPGNLAGGFAHYRAAHAARIRMMISDLDVALFPGVGHFPHREDPDRAAAEIAAFFQREGWR
jgi:pimeloyl-ACP methyl ester carboxylesterase